MSTKTGKLLVTCYLTALALWLVSVVAGLAQTAWYGHKGLYRDETVGLEELELKSAKIYDHEDYPGTWFVSTDSDPQLLWEGEAYLNRVVLKIAHEKPGNGVELYYRLAGHEEFSGRQVVYAERTPEGWYQFDLRGKRVSGLRIDPDSLGGVLTKFEGLELDAPWPLAQRLVPPPGAVLLMLTLPLCAAALIRQVTQWRDNEEG